MAKLTHKAPRRIALICANDADTTGIARWLLDDFQDALLAYDRASSVPSARLDPPAFERIDDARTVDLSRCDTLVVGFSLAAGAANAADTLDIQAERPAQGLRPETPVYAIGVTDAYEPELAEPAFSEISRWCQANGLAWSGGLIMGGGSLAPALIRSPRMGMMRRRWSEAMDRLIAAVRAGLTVKRAAETFGATPAQMRAARRDVVLARCALPRPLYQAVTTSRWFGFLLRRSR